MGVYRKNETWWVDFYYQGKRFRQKIGTRKKDAEDALNQIKLKIASGDFVPMEECAEKFIQYISVLRKNNTVFKFDYDNGRLTVYPALLNKGLPLAEVYRLNGISPSETVVAGDDFPDLCMMSRDLAFSAVCPGNAHPEVKKHVRSMDGEVGEAESGDGIIQAFTTLAEKQGWQF